VDAIAGGRIEQRKRGRSDIMSTSERLRSTSAEDCADETHFAAITAEEPRSDRGSFRLAQCGKCGVEFELKRARTSRDSE
jgi:hypothetical protein